MAFRRFSALLVARLTLVGIVAAAAAWLWFRPGLHGLFVIAAVVLAMLVGELWWYISRTNREVSRFLDAARYADFSQRFDFDRVGAGFEELADTFSEILDRMSAVRMEQETELRRLRALIEHTPVPLLLIFNDDSIMLQNNAARRLFGTASVTRLKDLRQFGVAFHDAVDQSVPGRRELVSFAVDEVEYNLTLATTENIVAGEAVRLVSLQDIQAELHVTQAQAWQELVSVLTHEIMNSITPVRSLAASASEVIDDMGRRVAADSDIAEDFEDLRDAVRTLEKRSDNLMEFVGNYRQLTRLAPPEKKRIVVADLFDSVTKLARAEWQDDRDSLSWTVTPDRLDVYADRVLLEPVLLNLLRNAYQATQHLAQPEIVVTGGMNRRGNVVVEVSDNGPGVPDDLTRKIFVPFFTTREQGSGVGLALARQVMTAHGGFIRPGRSEQGGAKFTLTF